MLRIYTFVAPQSSRQTTCLNEIVVFGVRHPYPEHQCCNYVAQLLNVLLSRCELAIARALMRNDSWVARRTIGNCPEAIVQLLQAPGHYDASNAHWCNDVTRNNVGMYVAWCVLRCLALHRMHLYASETSSEFLHLCRNHGRKNVESSWRSARSSGPPLATETECTRLGTRLKVQTDLKLSTWQTRSPEYRNIFVTTMRTDKHNRMK